MKCLPAKLRISLALDDGRPLDPGTERHLAQCPDCAARWNARRELVSELRRAPGPAPLVDPPPYLRARIMRAIQAESPASRGWVPAWPEYWRGAAAAVVVVLAIGAALLMTGKPDAAPVTGNPVAAVTAPVKTTNNPLILAAAKLDQPLRREWDLIHSDALAVVNSLRADFLPGELLR